jgi:hypothetical protein
MKILNGYLELQSTVYINSLLIYYRIIAYSVAIVEQTGLRTLFFLQIKLS